MSESITANRLYIGKKADLNYFLKQTTRKSPADWNSQLARPIELTNPEVSLKDAGRQKHFISVIHFSSQDSYIRLTLCI